MNIREFPAATSAPPPRRDGGGPPSDQAEYIASLEAFARALGASLVSKHRLLQGMVENNLTLYAGVQLAAAAMRRKKFREAAEYLEGVTKDGNPYDDLEIGTDPSTNIPDWLKAPTHD